MEPEAEVPTPIGTDMEIESCDRRVRLREESTDHPKHTLGASTDRWWNRVGKMSRRAQSTEASPSEPPQTSVAAANNTSNGERLHESMTVEGRSGDFPDDDAARPDTGRWIPTKGERTMTTEKAREARRNFHVGESKEHGTCSIASAKASPLHGEFFFSRRNADEVW